MFALTNRPTVIATPLPSPPANTHISKVDFLWFKLLWILYNNIINYIQPAYSL